MVDFLMISTRNPKKGIVEIYPKFIVGKSKDLMIRGGDFYAIWIEELGLWSTDEEDALRIIDRELDRYAQEHASNFDGSVHILHLWDSDSGMIDRWHRYCQKHMRDCYHDLDEKIIFSNAKTRKTDYASKRLSYPLEEAETPAYNTMMEVLYSPSERTKIEWAIGSVINGDSKKLQKFLVLYGAPGTGKGTVLDLIQQLFDGYFCVFDAKSLTGSNAFALEPFKANPLVGIQTDGDLSHIEDNSRLNALVSHEIMTVNEKFKSVYSSKFKAFLFMGTNKPVKITDAKSGLIRRLIDVTPTGEKLTKREYDKLKAQLAFELGGIAYHCKEVYESDPHLYDNYVPNSMMGATNDFYNYVLENYNSFRRNDSTTLKSAWASYITYCEEAKVPYPMSQRVFKEELKNYFREFKERSFADDGLRVRNFYTGFRYEKFDGEEEYEEIAIPETEPKEKPWLEFKEQHSIVDDILADCLAQYATEAGTPKRKWENVSTKLKDIDTSKLHYVKVPENHIVIDFDIPDENGNKSFEKNYEEALKWPPTYAELSKSGAGIHLHYIYQGDPGGLSNIYAPHIEIKVYSGGSALRRLLSKCNTLAVAAISSGLPLKGEKKVVSHEQIKSEQSLRRQIKRNLNKEIHPNTTQSVNFIFKILEDCYESGLNYDVTDMRTAVLQFAANSTNHAKECIKLVSKMKFKSQDTSEWVPSSEDKLVFFDCEVFINLFVICWKFRGAENPVQTLINPKPQDIEPLLKFKLVGFNNRDYDNHIVYGAYIGKSNRELYELSQNIITKRTGKFGEAYNLSYTDIYDFSSKKQSLKKFEIELGIHHQELGLPWDQPVPEELWNKVAEYCANDVIATEAVFESPKRQADFTAREVLADVAGMSVNDTTNSLTTRIIFGRNKHPQSEFHYRDLGSPYDEDRLNKEPSFMKNVKLEDTRVDGFDEFTVFDEFGQPYFPGYKYENGISTYRGIEAGEGGYVYSDATALGHAEMYGNVALLDIASMHPSSVIAEELFGPEYTRRFKEILDARIAIKHKDYDKARGMLDGKLAKYLDDPAQAKNLAQALKIAINSVYGLTAAGFENPFRDIRNKDNIVAKRGALFMINLKFEVEKRGFVVAHIKTDSIKIPDATPEIIKFVMDYGKMYGYNFEHEATYERMCLVNDAVYIAKYATERDCENLYGYVPDENRELSGQWTATGAQFQVPFVFKHLFSKEPIGFEDMCETKNVSKGAIYLDMNEELPDVSQAEKSFDKILKKDPDSDITGILEDIAKGHDYYFVGRVGLFCPIKPGCGGGELVRELDGKYHSVTGTKGFRWLEAETVKNLGKEDDIDLGYYYKLVDEAINTIKESEHNSYDWFVSDSPYRPPLFTHGHPDYAWDLPF